MKNIVSDIASAIIAIFVFLIFFFLIRWNIFISAAIALGLFAALVFLLKPVSRIGRVAVDSVNGGELLLKQFNEGIDHINAIGETIARIPEQDVRDKAAQLRATGENIISYLRDHPDRITLARRFINYHLPTTRNLLEKYVAFKRTNLKTEQIERIFSETSSALETLNKAFEAQFEQLMHNEMMDVETDLEVLETMLKTENIK